MVRLKPQKQLIKHSPENGDFGDCYRTAVAVVLGVEASEVPHVCECGETNVGDLDGLIAMREYLLARGVAISKSVYNGDLSWSAFRDWMAKFNPNTVFIATGQSVRGTNHCVVMVGGKVVCDPLTGLPDQDCMVGPAIADGEENWWVEVMTDVCDTQTPKYVPQVSGIDD